MVEDFHGALTQAAARCRRHLSRTAFSFRVVADVLEHTPDADLIERYGTLLEDALGGDLGRVDRLEPIVARSHLSLQRRHFELFLHRIAAIKWEHHRDEVLRRWGQPVRVPSEGFGTPDGLPRFALGEHNAPSAGLVEITEHLRTILGLTQPFPTWAGLDRRHEVRDVGPGGESLQVHLWSQLFVSFRVRHLFEYRDARVDRAFRNAVTPHWGGSSWRTWADALSLDRRDDRGRAVQVPVRPVDFLATTAVMVEAIRGITAAVSGTGAGAQAR